CSANSFEPVLEKAVPFLFCTSSYTVLKQCRILVPETRSAFHPRAQRNPFCRRDLVKSCCFGAWLVMRRRQRKCLIIKVAEGVRFELTRAFGLPVFKTGAINRSATPPDTDDR